MEFFFRILASVIHGLIFGFIAKYIAESRGDDTGFAWGFWLGLIGVLVVGLRPSKVSTPAYSNAQAVPKVEWECGCGAMNSDSLNYCFACRRNRGEYKPRSKVKCPHCGAFNTETNDVCFACNKPLSETKEIIQQPAVVEKNKIAQTIENNDFVTMLEKLAKLHERGILTDEEFQQKKSDILAKI